MGIDVAFKVKYGDTMRRFNAVVSENDMNREMTVLINKIRKIFELSLDAVLILTYIDEDKDQVTFIGGEELRDAIFCQHHNPLKINVTVPPKKRYNLSDYY